MGGAQLVFGKVKDVSLRTNLRKGDYLVIHDYIRPKKGLLGDNA